MYPAAALLFVEFFDELVFGAWTAAWPLIRSDLGLSYTDVGLLLALPNVFASILEPPIGLLGDAWNRRALVRAGGLAFVGGVLLMAASGGFASLLLALMLVFPASGVFVSLSQATLMDLDPQRHETNMARWVLAGSLGVASGPVLLAGAAAAGLQWRGAFVAVAGVGFLALALAWRVPSPHTPTHDSVFGGALAAAHEALRALRDENVLRWLALIHVADLMLDVLLGFLALYYVDVLGATTVQAAAAVLVVTLVGLAGDALIMWVLKRVEAIRYVRLSSALAILSFSAFLLVGDPVLKLVLLGALALLTSGWYAIMKGRLYSALPGRSATVMALDSFSGTLGGLLPLAIGMVAQRYGLDVAMWLLLAAPVTLLVGLPRRKAENA